MPTFPRTAFAALTALALLFAAPLHASVITVDNSGGPADFSSLQAAIDAASDGDILLVKRTSSAAYGSVVIDGKALVLQADGTSGTAQVEPSIVRNLAADQSVVLRGLTFAVGVSGTDLLPSLTLIQCDGQVSIDTCVIFGRLGNPLVVSDNAPQPGLLVQLCERVAITNSFVRGGTGEVGPGAEMQAGAAALQVLNAVLSITDTGLQGGPGASPVGNLTPPAGTPAGVGGPGLSLDEGRVWLTGSAVTGGPGGNGFEYPGFCQQGGMGGTGLLITNQDALLRRRDCFVAGGAGGTGGGGQLGNPCAPDGDPGPDVSVLPGTLALLPAPSSSYVAPSPLREGESGSHVFTGPPGATILLWISLEPDFLTLLGRQGVFHAGFPTLKDSGFLFGTLNAAGERVLDLTVPPISGIDGLLVHLQTAVGSSGAFTLGDWSVQVVLDDGF